MSTALYRRYRPETFQEVIGQGHVTEPLTAALRADRTNHAYLFSGPRGCGKTTSARILARCLNCAQGPTDTPCGECPSCRELAREGSGSLDVVEIDAASHGGVDDARDLRERATFAPARDRYKIFIIDEAHMVSQAGFNALLKIVEEPPEHLRFVFATTEPDKVIGTIRSRTHHYPFRLVPPEELLGYLEQLCETEGVRVGGGVLPMVVRAGGGSVRDTLSVLDQLLAGADESGLDYDRALALLGYTDAALLDDAVDALAARDGASLFRVVDRVIESGHDPRRFVEDLLERLRDLVLIAMAGDHAAAALRGQPEDQLARMQVQARNLGPAQLSRGADLVNEALTEMTGATSPRLQLELLCARLLLPGADDADAGYGARLDRLERNVAAPPAAAGPGPSAGTEPARSAGPARSAEPAAAAEPVGPGAPAAPDAPGTPAEPAPPEPPEPGEPHVPARPAAATAQDPPADQPAPAGQGPAASTPTPAPAPEMTPPATTDDPGAPSDNVGDAEMIRRRWSEVVATLARLRRATWALVSQNAQVGSVRNGTLQLLFSTSGLAATFRTGAHAQHVERALVETLGTPLRVEGIVDDGGAGGNGGEPVPPGPAPADSRSAPSSAVADAMTSWATPATAPRAPSPAPQDDASGAAGTELRPAAVPEPDGASNGHEMPPEPAPDGPADTETDTDTHTEAAAPAPVVPAENPAATAGTVEHADRARPERPGVPRSATPADRVSAASPGSATTPAPPRVAPADDVPSADDPDAEGSGMVGAPLVAQILGGTVIEEITTPDGAGT
ncbi:DNA polymerase III subunit gamma and tau [Georgenia deserti]|uniref:DNA polymerase III subunit gamma/tau n=1 Tax=Georgenia deserti TaxID=2093781 RepID=A0ABW4LC16_9MICO